MPNSAVGQSQSNSKLGQKKKTRREGVLLNQCKSSVNYATYLTRWSTGLSLEWAGLCCQISGTDYTFPWINTSFSISMCVPPPSCFSHPVLGLLKSSSSVHRCDSVIQPGSFKADPSALPSVLWVPFSLALSILLTAKGFGGRSGSGRSHLWSLLASVVSGPSAWPNQAFPSASRPRSVVRCRTNGSW